MLNVGFYEFYHCYFHTHLFGRIFGYMKKLETRFFVLGICVDIFSNTYLYYTSWPNYSTCSTCITFAISYNGFALTPKGGHVVKTTSWLITLRTHSTVDRAVDKYELGWVFSKALNDRYVSSFCYISGVRISGRQFFPLKQPDILLR